MSLSVLELSQRLENVLDTDYNVLDMPTVLDIIAVLENTSITIEQLENSQLIRCINHMRRHTEDDVLARRSKNLIKRWRAMLPVVSPNGKIAKFRHNGDSNRRRRHQEETPDLLEEVALSPKPQELPRRRGRKRGSYGVDAILGDAMDTSPYLEFKHKVASGPKKVKTTKELLADLQSRKLGASSATTSPVFPLRMPAAVTPEPEEILVEVPTSGDVEKEIQELKRQLATLVDTQTGVEDEVEPACTCTFTEIHETEELGNGVTKPSVLVLDGLKVAVTDGETSMGGRKPPVRSIFDLDETDDPTRIEFESATTHMCDRFTRWRCLEDPTCPARREYGEVTAEDVSALHSLSLGNVNGNWSVVTPSDDAESLMPELPVRVVPYYGHLVQDSVPKYPEPGVRWRRKRRRANNNADDDEVTPEGVFREWFQTIHLKSYNDELMTILPYVVID
ncbi:uncharacterized protein LOC132257025 [Phlebotomus argentipes]|uniref:uncharacterized protein LOC132257025 n=1 Tax=Phlebotomus argentipes TaxID=94469 RepID=UPI0028929EF8|nr:uncharacterized protein LOC132257025 [Phlebotomus argentipes]